MAVATLLAVLGSAPPAWSADDPPAETPDAAKAAYLAAHQVVSGPVAGGLTFRFPADLYRSRLILVGESHGSAAPQVFDLELLRRLRSRTGLRDYLAEVDPVQAEALNRFLATGDEAILARVFAFWRDAQWGNTAFEDKLRNLRALNLTLAPGLRVRLHGIDAVQDWPLLLDRLAAEGVAIDRAKLEAESRPSDKAALVLAALAAAPPTPLHDLLRAVLAKTAARSGRERTLFAGYAHIVRSGALGGRQAYGLWGLFHVLQAPVNGVEPFAALVRRSDLPAARSLASIVLLSLDSAVMVPAGGRKARMTTFNVDGPMIRVQGAASLRAASAPGAFSVFDLGARGSPYLTSPDFATIRSTIGQAFTPDDPKAPATAYARYVGVFRGSDWAPPIP